MNTLMTSCAAVAACLAACASTSSTAGRDAATAQVGIYTPPMPGQPRLRVGIPQFNVKAKGADAQLGGLAADQITSLAVNSQRFDVIERAQLDQLLKEQGLEGVVAAEGLARPAQVQGVDCLLIGKVTNLRVQRDRTGSSFNLGNLPVPFGGGGALSLFGVGNKDTVLKVQCGVDLRLVDPTTGATLVADFAEYDRQDAASALGLQILGGSAASDADVQVDEDDQGRILRLALDDCLRKMLPKIDSVVQKRQRDASKSSDAAASASASTSASASETPSGPVAAAAAGAPTNGFCSHCGNKLAADAMFCPGCGTKAR
jgi:curli biogenesis system outer membrane secretion channel CsgG